MGRSWRASEGGYIYHVLNRAHARLPLFQKDGDYAAFERVLEEARQRYEVPMQGNRILFPAKTGEDLQQNPFIPAGAQALAA